MSLAVNSVGSSPITHIDCIDQMPERILLKIFSYLPINDQISAQKVCKQWHNFLNNQDLRKKFNLDAHWKDHVVPIVLLSKFPEFRELASRIRWIQASNIIKSVAEDPPLLLVNAVEAVSRRSSSPPVELEELAAQAKNLDGNFFGIPFSRIFQILGLSMTAYNTYTGIQNSYESAKQQSHEELVEALRLPENLIGDPILGRYICPISGRVPLIPVIDKCNHLFDYLYIGDHITKKIECPITHQHLAQNEIKFDLETFINIQKRLADLKRNNHLVQGIRIQVFRIKIFKFPEQLP